MIIDKNQFQAREMWKTFYRNSLTKGHFGVKL